MKLFPSGGARRPLIARAAAAAAVVGFFVLAGTAAGQSTAAVSIIDLSFQPADVTVNAGDTVTWTVTKAIADPHSVTSGTPGAESGVFDSQLTLHNNGDTFSYTFATAGTFPYFCKVHPAQMRGTVTVTAAGQSGTPTGTTAPASAAPASAAPGSPAPGSSAPPSPAASTIPGGVEPRTPPSTTDRLVAAGIIGLTLLILFGAATLYRRVNR